MKEAIAFNEQAKKRPKESCCEVKDLRQALTEAYEKMLKEHADVV